MAFKYEELSLCEVEKFPSRCNLLAYWLRVRTRSDDMVQDVPGKTSHYNPFNFILLEGLECLWDLFELQCPRLVLFGLSR